ncbi:hypothetical protein [Synechococcus sp. M16CYN]|uniref:hypothetical protein n=1 Tax=Synechococcus sp. M16CYN TaxID=3103139 RepID=UPI00334102AD
MVRASKQPTIHGFATAATQPSNSPNRELVATFMHKLLMRQRLGEQSTAEVLI